MICHVCPWWLGYLLDNPVRRWLHQPEKILAPYVEPGMTVLEVGPGMGFFSVPMAQMLGPDGRLICVDVQERMLKSLKNRMGKAGLAERVQARHCGPHDLDVGDLAGAVDFVLLFAVVHEVPDQAQLLRQTFATLRAGGELLIAEPKGHVSDDALAATISLAEAAGLRVVDRPAIPSSRSVRLVK